MANIKGIEQNLKARTFTVFMDNGAVYYGDPGESIIDCVNRCEPKKKLIETPAPEKTTVVATSVQNEEPIVIKGLVKAFRRQPDGAYKLMLTDGSVLLSNVNEQVFKFVRRCYECGII